MKFQFLPFQVENTKQARKIKNFEEHSLIKNRGGGEGEYTKVSC